MHKCYHNYYWKGGKPHGQELVDPLSPLAYKIVTDPYGKRYSIEKYREGQFERIVYDSLLLDFRHLTAANQMAWQRENLKEDEASLVCLLRNQEDRAILLETHHFDAGVCLSCAISSIHGLPLATQKLYYQSKQHLFDGVVLFDLESRPVMMKTYQVDPLSGEFTTLLKEEWDMQVMPQLLHAFNPLQAG